MRVLEGSRRGLCGIGFKGNVSKLRERRSIEKVSEEIRSVINGDW